MMTWSFADQASSKEIWKDIHINSAEKKSFKKTDDGKLLHLISL